MIKGGIKVPDYMEPIVSEILCIIENAAINDEKRSSEMLRPCMMVRPVLKREYGTNDGNDSFPIWIAESGEFHIGGMTPAEAFENFDKAWRGEQP